MNIKNFIQETFEFYVTCGLLIAGLMGFIVFFGTLVGRYNSIFNFNKQKEELVMTKAEFIQEKIGMYKTLLNSNMFIIAGLLSMYWLFLTNYIDNSIILVLLKVMLFFMATLVIVVWRLISLFKQLKQEVK